jgi:hypothetical protein
MSVPGEADPRAEAGLAFGDLVRTSARARVTVKLHYPA